MNVSNPHPRTAGGAHFTGRDKWASYQIRKIAGCACAGNAGNISPHHWFQRKPLVSDPGMHHGTCVPHVPWCMSGSLTLGGGENVPGIPGTCATRNFTYLARGPLKMCISISSDNGNVSNRRQSITWIDNGIMSTLLMLVTEYSSFWGSISYPLMPRLLKLPGHQQTWYLQYRIGSM